MTISFRLLFFIFLIKISKVQNPFPSKEFCSWKWKPKVANLYVSKRYKKDKKWAQQHWGVCVCVCVCVLGEADESERCSLLPYGTWAYIAENHVRTKRRQTKLKFQNTFFDLSEGC